MNSNIVSFFLYNSKKIFSSHSLLWDQKLPNTRYGDNRALYNITYGDYFKILSSFLQQHKFKFLKKAIEKKIKKSIFTDKIKHISIRLEKHGAFYHPSKIKVLINETIITFVANIAISEKGRECMEREIASLNLLNKTTKFKFLPQIYYHYLNKFIFNIKFSIFIAEWFENFHEFHLSKIVNKDINQVLIWDSIMGNKIVPQKYVIDIYNQIAMILSLYYDPITTKHISSWHNASGDFVVKINENIVTVRLITVRNFSPMLVGNRYCDLSDNEIMYAIIIFFLHTSFRIRLDRLDGIKNLVLANCMYIYPIVEGFFRGLQLKEKESFFLEDFTIFFRAYILNHTEKDLLDLSIEIINKIYKKQREEYLIISSKIDEHIKYLYNAVETLEL